MNQSNESTSNDSTATARSTRGRKGSRKGKAKAASARTARSTTGRSTTANVRTARSKGFDLHDAFRREVGQMVEVESGLERACKKLEKQTTDPELQRSLEELRECSASYGRSLNRVIAEHGKSRKRADNGAARLLVRSIARAATTHTTAGEVMTTTELQKLLHYSIATYGSLKAWSREIGDRDGEILFERLADERKEQDAELSDVALAILERVDREGGQDGSNGRSNGSSNGGARRRRTARRNA
jgi:ferritin-like metal-binding protein YciE